MPVLGRASMFAMRGIVSGLLILLAVSTPCRSRGFQGQGSSQSAQKDRSSDSDKGGKFPPVNNLLDKNLSNNSGYPNPVRQTQCDQEDSATKQACIEWVKSWYEANTAINADRYRVYLWQLAASWAVLITMVVLMVSGLLIGVWQFYLSFRVSMLVLNWHHSAKGSDPQGATLSELKDLLSSNLEFSKNGLKIASPIVGIIVLGLSIVFLWVFAKEIYPIVH